MSSDVSSACLPWLKSYPEGVPSDIDLGPYTSLAHLLESSMRRYAERTAYHFMGKDYPYQAIDRASQALGAWLQARGLVKGDRVGVMLPNIPQYPVAVAAILRAGLVVVNINPLYTQRELEQQLRDSGAQAIVVFESFAATLSACLAATPVRHVVLCAMGDTLGWLRGSAINHMVRKVRRLVPPFELPGAVRYPEALRQGSRLALQSVPMRLDDMAVLQYTGGTTGISKGAVLLHRNLIANVLQCEAWNAPAMRQIPPHEQATAVCALPLHHIFAFTVNMLLCLHQGGRNLLIPHPRDVGGLLNVLRQHTFHHFPAVNTLFDAVLQHPDFDQVDWRSLKVAVGGGMPVHEEVARRWRERTGVDICEGYGLSETSPCVSCNPVDSPVHNGSIGVPLPGTRMKCIDEEGREVAAGHPGEIAIQGPQVMAGYWQRPDETAKVMTRDGWLRTGDIGVMDAQGHFRIVDRKKDMILISGFNVYPNEIEDIAMGLPGVQECAAVGIPTPQTGEAVKLIIVRKDPSITEEHVRAHCRQRMTPYKQPEVIEFRNELPRSAVGKVLRRELRNKA
jgi:long-chain acyl-CoA synthetase